MTKRTKQLKITPNNQSNPGPYFSVETLTDGAHARLADLFPYFANGGYEECLKEAGGIDLLKFDMMKGGECGNEPERADVWVTPTGPGNVRADQIQIKIISYWWHKQPHFEITIYADDWHRPEKNPITGETLATEIRFGMATTLRAGRRLDARRIAARALDIVLT